MILGQTNKVQMIASRKSQNRDRKKTDTRNMNKFYEEDNKMDNKKRKRRMAGSYEIIRALRIGERVVVLGYDPNNANGMYYMTAYYEKDGTSGRYTFMMKSADYAWILEHYAERIAGEAHALKTLAGEDGISAAENMPYGENTNYYDPACKPLKDYDYLRNRVVVIRQNVFRHEYRTAANQLYLCIGGPGAEPFAQQTKIDCINLYTGQKASFDRGDVLSIMSEAGLPDWAEPKLLKIRQDNKDMIISSFLKEDKEFDV